MARRKFDIDSLPSNNLNEPERTELEAVTTGRVKTRKRGGLANNVRSIGNALFATHILPGMKAMVLDFAWDGLRQAIYGRSDGDHRDRGGPVPYNKQYQTQSPSRIRRMPNQQQIVQAQHVEEVFEDIFFRDRREAEHVLGRMMERIHEYGWVTVGDLYSLTGLSPSYSAESWVWYNLNRCNIHYTGDGYLIGFPDPEWRKR